MAGWRGWPAAGVRVPATHGTRRGFLTRTRNRVTIQIRGDKPPKQIGETVETDTGRVISLLAGVWDHVATMAAADGVPEQDRGGIAAQVLPAFLDGVRDKYDNGKLAQVCGVAYLAALTDYRNGGRA